jgi:hypothetical protein
MRRRSQSPDGKLPAISALIAADSRLYWLDHQIFSCHASLSDRK